MKTIHHLCLSLLLAARPLVLLVVSHLALRTHATPRILASQTPRPPTVSVAIQPDNAAETSPTLANFQRVANQSPEHLDALLSRQDKSPTATTPVCTASATSLNF